MESVTQYVKMTLAKTITAIVLAQEEAAVRESLPSVPLDVKPIGLAMESVTRYV